MNQLTLESIYSLAIKLIKKGEDISQYPIYLGNDDELNGIHCGWYVNMLDVKDADSKDFIEMINEDRCCIELKDKGILIS